MERELKGGSPQTGASFAQRCQTAPAGSLRNAPPKGPKPEPVRLNGVPKIGGSGIK